MNCIDVHAHYCPAEYFKRLESRKSIPYVQPAADGSWLLRYGKDKTSGIRERMYSLEHRLEEMDSLGIRTQVLSPLLHGVHKLPPRTGLELCRLVNDGVADVAQKYQGRFEGFGVLPLQGINQSLEELERVVQTLGFKGVVFFSNIEGEFLDAVRLWPIYERVAALNVPIFLHPTHPVNDKGMKDHNLVSCLGFLYDTTLTMSRIIFSGLLERYANLKFILPHLGSLIPYITARIDKEQARDAKKESMKRAPSEYFKLVYVDTVSLHAPALMLATSYLGTEKILFGCDYPFWGLGEGFDSVQGLNISDQDKENIFYRNAQKLLGLPS
jgi:aminocarboxymuconate-semialdehyde decarboxylase